MSWRTRNVIAAGIAAVTVLAFASQANAQVQEATTADSTRYEQKTGRAFQPGEWVYVAPLITIFRRERPELDPLGIRAGGWRIDPALNARVAFNDNIFASDTNEQDDTIYYLEPSVRVASQWSQHMLGAEAYGRIRRYTDFDTEDAEEGGVTVFGRFDIQENQDLYGSLAASSTVEGRTVSIENNIAVPVEVRKLIARAGYTYDFARASLRVEAEGRDIDYSPASQNDRDRQELWGAATFSFSLTPRITPFVRATYETRNYDQIIVIDRDSDSYALEGGARIEINDVMYAELALGGTQTNFSNSAFDDVTTFSAAGELTWNITTLTSLIGHLERSEQPTSEAGASSKTVTSASLRAEHELLRTLLLYANARYYEEEFQQLAGDREDQVFGVDVGAEWLLNRWLTAFGDYHFDQRESNVVGEDFTANVFVVGARLRY